MNPTPAKQQARKLWVHLGIQGQIVMRVTIYWLVSLFCFSIVYSLINRFQGIINGGEAPVDFLTTLITMTAVSATLLPILAYDALKFSRSLLGPIIKFQLLINKHTPQDFPHVKLRKDDYWHDLMQQFQIFLQSHRPTPSKTNQTAESTVELDQAAVSPEIVSADQGGVAC